MNDDWVSMGGSNQCGIGSSSTHWINASMMNRRVDAQIVTIDDRFIDHRCDD
jgi:hypothetical protein